jgi:hypothetical protein
VPWAFSRRTTEGMPMAKVHQLAGHPVPVQSTWAERWEGSDRGLICSWLRGVEKALEIPVLREMALRGELPPLAWKGGSDKALKAAKRIGSLHYLAAWQGLRGDDLNIDTDVAFSLTCTRFQTVVTFTDDIQALALAPSEEA